MEISRQKKITAKNFPAKIYSTVDILIVDIEHGIESDSDDEEEYCLEDDDTIDNLITKWIMHQV